MKKTRLISMLCAIAMSLTLVLPVSASANRLPSKSVEEILSEFHLRSFNLTQAKANNPSILTTHISESLASIRHETVNELLDMGYSAYEVTSSTYETVEEMLNTDLSSLGLQKDSSYIVIVGDTNTDAVQSRKTTGSPYYYQYGGKQYKLRDVTITGADSSNYNKANSVDLLTSHTDAAVEGLLNAVISVSISAAGVPWILGTIGSITGLTSVDFVSAKESTAVFHAGSSWTRVFTQVWDNNYAAWVAGASVEYVTKVSHINGLKYTASLNRYQDYTSNEKIDVSYSPNYHSDTWHKENAVIAFIGAFPNRSDAVGNVYYKYDSKVIVTHLGGFI